MSHRTEGRGPAHNDLHAATRSTRILGSFEVARESRLDVSRAALIFFIATQNR